MLFHLDRHAFQAIHPQVPRPRPRTAMTWLIIIYRVAKWNRRTLNEEELKIHVPKEDEVDNSTSSFKRLMKSHKLTTCLQGAVWLASGLTYFGLSLVADDLGGTLYRDFIFLSFMEFPVFPVAIFMSNRYEFVGFRGRTKKTNTFFEIFSAVFYFIQKCPNSPVRNLYAYPPPFETMLYDK